MTSPGCQVTGEVNSSIFNKGRVDRIRMDGSFPVNAIYYKNPTGRAELNKRRRAGARSCSSACARNAHVLSFGFFFFSFHLSCAFWHCCA